MDFKICSGSCYKISNERTDWYTARSKCADLDTNAELVSIYSSPENEFVIGTYSNLIK